MWKGGCSIKNVPVMSKAEELDLYVLLGQLEALIDISKNISNACISSEKTNMDHFNTLFRNGNYPSFIKNF